ncbi:MAG: 1-acyl-sn-glycerol-3-phosphate acyltransferase [Tannerellaceae bacterium]|jgi:putative hemolysin|nr:1-acyl-sn-glycerol-3-phosphate acyltransferase [Tannerellaceae bacterium]
MAKENQKKIIDIRKIIHEKAPKLEGKIPSFIINYLIRIVHQNEINKILHNLHGKEGITAMTELFKYFDIRLNIHGTEKLLHQERYIFASNHPLGGLDGICLSYVIGNIYNGNVRLPVNDLLLFLPQLRQIFIPVNKHGRQDRQTVELTDQAYSSDNQIITFPAGLCSRKIKGVITDTEWKKSFIQKAIDYKRSVVPVHFDGKNSNFFYNLASFRKKLGIKLNLEMLYLADELFKSKSSVFNIYFGDPIPHTLFDKSRTIPQWAQWVKSKSYSLKNQQ